MLKAIAWPGSKAGAPVAITRETKRTHMRIAVLIISLCLTMVVGLQSCAVLVGGSMGKDQDLAGGGATGLLIAFLFVLGAAFAIGLPRVSMVLFAIAAAAGLRHRRHDRL